MSLDDDIQKLKRYATACQAWQDAGCPVGDPLDTYPSDLYDAAVMPRRMLEFIGKVEALQAVAEARRLRADANAAMWRDEKANVNALEYREREALAHLRTIASFGGNIEAARKLALKGIKKIEGES